MPPIEDLHEGRAIAVKAVAFGHIRLGIFNGRYPQQSKTFIFTSKDPQRLAPLAARYGGTVERYEPQGAGEEPWRVITEAEAMTALPAFPTFDESCQQSWELWGSGGIKRRCTGRTCTTIDVDEITGDIDEETVPCICAETDNRICAPATRLHLLLPETGLGVWTLQTNSKVAAIELHDQMRLVETVAPDRLNHVPIRLIYGDRNLHYKDPKTHKRTATTKRIVSVSIAGDAMQALAALGMEPDRALLAAVTTVLQGSGAPGEIALGEGATAPAALPEGAPHAGVVPVELESAGEGARAGASSSAAPDEPAPPEQWARAKQLGLGGAAVLKRARVLFPDAGVSKVSDITRDQLAAVISEAMK